MTETSWLNSANRRPKPKLADYTRQPVKLTHPPANIRFESPKINIPLSSSAEALSKSKRKRQKMVIKEKHKKSKDVASPKPTGRPRRASVLTKSYRELSDSQTESETNEPSPAKKFITKQPEKPQSIASVQNRAARVEPPIKKICTLRSMTVHKALKEKELPNHGKSRHKETIAKVWGSTKGQESLFPPEIPPSCASPLPSNIDKSAMTSTATLRSALAPVVPVCKQAQTPQVRQSSSVQAIVQERHNDVHSDQTEKENEQAGKHETWASKQMSLYHSPFSIEKMRSAEKNASVPKSTLLQPLCISPVGAISPTLELPSHVRGIQASSFYRTSGRDSAAYLPHSFATPIVQGQTAQKNAEPSSRQLFVPPLIASTGRETGSSLLIFPDPEEELKGFLNNTSQGALQASFDKESVISLVTLSQSSHTSMKNVSVICTELEKTPASVQGGSDGKAESGPTTTRTWHNSQLCNCTSLSERDDSEDEDKMNKTGPGELAVRMKPRKLFNPNVSQPSMKKGSKQPMQVGSSVEEGEKESVVSSCWEPSVKADMDLVQSEMSTSQEMGYVCRQFSSEFKRKFENRSRRMDLFTKQSLKACKQHVSTITMKVQQYRSQRLETVKQVLMEEIKNMEQDERSLRNMETELTGYWKKQALSFHSYHERETQRLNNLKSTIATNASQNLDYEEQIFFSQMHLMKKDMKSVQDHLFRQMHEDELQNVRRGLQTFLSDVPMFLK